jgi:hypothetical protein
MAYRIAAMVAGAAAAGFFWSVFLMVGPREKLLV